jgi:oligosaccharide repeat unit polymerase
LFAFKPATELRNRTRQPFRLGFSSPKYFMLAFCTLLSISILGSSYYFYKVGISLFSDEVGLARLLNRHDVSGSYVWQRLFRVLLPILCLTYFFMKNLDPMKKYYSNFAAVSLFFITACFLVFTGLRGNLLTFMLTPLIFGVSINLIRTSMMLKIMGGLFAVSGALFISSLMYAGRGLDLLDLTLLIWKRLTSAATDGIEFAIYDDVPRHGLYLGETYFWDIMSLPSKLGLVSENVKNYSAYAAENLLGVRYNGEAAAVYVFGEFYVNFGGLGVVFLSIVLGVFLQGIYISVIRSRKTILRAGIYSYSCGVLVTILGGPTLSMAIDYSMTIFAFGFVFVLIASLRTLSYRSG